VEKKEKEKEKEQSFALSRTYGKNVRITSLRHLCRPGHMVLEAFIATYISIELIYNFLRKKV
jgi:hypothetical protein